ncbi:hypothetical protein GOP47_0005268 [Adiantum capillus-veneris]|uniref:Uncharacterized protein n=1 Tax=Adiantum capillus-veneris TaxID=13818 RepID=A0A9D4V581_ADICA|nr:hypothetical protein GOP47_0005268 [Adiantum capillus-veneris]
MLVVVIIMAATAIFLICYYWAALVRKAMSYPPSSPASPPPPSPPPSTLDQVFPASEYKIFMKLTPLRATCPPSTVVLMPGEDVPTFLAMPCRACSMDTLRMEEQREKTAANNMGDAAEVKLEVFA